MKLLKAIYSDGRTSYITLCDECMVEADGLSPVGMWALSCGHALCSNCTDYGLRNNKKPHIQACPDWKLGSQPTEDAVERARLSLERQGYKIPYARIIE